MDGRWLGRVLAVVGPAVVGLAAFAWLDGWVAGDDVVELRNAGRVLNARVTDDDAAASIDRLLARSAPKVVVVGPSYANTDVRVDLLAAKLGLLPEDVAMIAVPNSVSAHWYAILRWRLFEAGHRPALVVVVSGLQSMLLTTPLTEASFVNLEVQLPPEGDPVVDRLVGAHTGLVWARLREQRGKVRGAVFDALRELPGRAVGVGPLQARLALESVFDDANVDMDLYAASTNIAGGQAEPRRFYTPDLLPAPEDGFVPLITELVREHGARVVWVRPPMSPFIPEELDDRVLPGVQERTVALVEERRGSFLDMRSLPMSSAMFKNEDHMNADGSRRFSEALGAALVDLDALEPDADPASVGPLGVSPLPDGFAIDGWVPERGTFAVDAVLTGDAAPALSVNGLPLPVTPDGPGRFVASSLPKAPVGAFEVRVTGGRLVAASLGRGRGRVWLAGDRTDFEGHVARTVGETGVRPTWAKAPVRPPNDDRPVLDLPGAVAGFDTERWKFLSDEAVRGATTFGSSCSPLRIEEDGRRLGPSNQPCSDVERDGHGRSCHTLDRLFFTAPDGTDPAHNGRAYRLVLDEARTCDRAVWLYPIDRMSVGFPPEAVAGLVEGARWLSIDARYLNQRSSTLKLRLSVQGRPVFEAELDGRDLRVGPRVFELPEPVRSTAVDVVAELESRDHVFYLVHDVSLWERRPPLP